MKCDGCGLESARAEIFKSAPRSFRSKELTLCPSCFEKKDDRTNVILIWSYLISGVLSLPLTLYSPTNAIGLLLLNISVFQLFVLLSTVLHELGHAVAGQLVGMRVFSIEIGKGRIVYEFLLGGLRWRFRAIPFGGITYTLPYSEKCYRIRKSLTILSGPMTNAILLWLSVKCLSLDTALNPTSFHGFVPMLLLALSNLLLLIVTLWPYMFNSVAGRIPSDGLLLWKVWRFTKSHIQELIATRYVYEVNEHILQKDLICAQKWVYDGLRHFPDNFQLKYSAAHILYEQKKYTKAVRAFALLLGRHKNDRNMDSYILNFIAYTYLMMDKPELLPKADTCSRLALEKIPWLVYNKGTRGAVLVELGKYEEGLRLLHDAMRNHTEKRGQALDACHIGIAEARRGDLAESHSYFTIARKLDPECVLLGREPAVEA